MTKILLRPERRKPVSSIRTKPVWPPNSTLRFFVAVAFQSPKTAWLRRLPGLDHSRFCHKTEIIVGRADDRAPGLSDALVIAPRPLRFQLSREHLGIPSASSGDRFLQLLLTLRHLRPAGSGARGTICIQFCEILTRLHFAPAVIDVLQQSRKLNSFGFCNYRQPHSRALLYRTRNKAIRMYRLPLPDRSTCGKILGTNDQDSIHVICQALSPSIRLHSICASGRDPNLRG